MRRQEGYEYQVPKVHKKRTTEAKTNRVVSDGGQVRKKASKEVCVNDKTHCKGSMTNESTQNSDECTKRTEMLCQKKKNECCVNKTQKVKEMFRKR